MNRQPSTVGPLWNDLNLRKIHHPRPCSLLGQPATNDSGLSRPSPPHWFGITLQNNPWSQPRPSFRLHQIVYFLPLFNPAKHLSQGSSLINFLHANLHLKVCFPGTQPVSCNIILTTANWYTLSWFWFSLLCVLYFVLYYFLCFIYLWVYSGILTPDF